MLTKEEIPAILAKLSGGTGVWRRAAKKDLEKRKKKLDKSARACYNSQAAQRYGSAAAEKQKKISKEIEKRA